jgi:hypothetical protein
VDRIAVRPRSRKLFATISPCTMRIQTIRVAQDC